MPPFGYGFVKFMSNNPIAQGVAAVIAFLLLKAGHAKYNQHKGAKREREKAREKALKIQTENREDLNEKSAQTVQARDDVGPVDGADSVPDDLRNILFGDGRND